jgi:thiol-disulfide isomerase/thioredoxin
MRLVAALLLALTLALSGCGRDEPARDPVLAGDLLGGGTYDAAGHRGKVTVVNFWGSWCAPCRLETPELVAAYEATRSEDVAFLGINVRDPDRDLAEAFVASFKVPYPSIYDPKGKLALEFDVPPTTIPATLILGRDGAVLKEYRRALRRDELTDAVRQALADG